MDTGGGQWHREWGAEWVHQKVNNFFWPWDAPSFASYLILIDWKCFQVPQGHVGHHGGQRERVPGGVHKVVHEPFYRTWDTSFLPSFSIVTN